MVYSSFYHLKTSREVQNSRHWEYILISIVETLRFNCEPAQLLFRVRSKPSSLRNYSNATEGGSTVLVSLAESMFSIADRTRVWMCFILHWNRASKLRIFIVNEHKKSQNSNFELKTTVGAFQILNLIFFLCQWMQLRKTLRTQVRLALSDQNKCQHHKKVETPFCKITVVKRGLQFHRVP